MASLGWHPDWARRGLALLALGLASSGMLTMLEETRSLLQSVPLGAAGFGLLALALVGSTPPGASAGARRMCRAAAGPVLCGVLVLWVRELSGGPIRVAIRPSLEHALWLAGPPSEFGMLSLALAAAAVWLLGEGSGRRRDAAGLLGLAAAVLGLVFCLGHLYRIPELVESRRLPMALGSSLASMFLGSAVMAAAGVAQLPLRIVAGSSIQARLLRVFVPFAALTVMVVSWLGYLAALRSPAAPAPLFTALLSVTAVLVVSLLCSAMARRLGQRIEAAERQAREDLERLVLERTRELRESQELLRGILDNSTAVIYAKDPEGRYILVNRRYEELFGLERGQAVGKTDPDIFPLDMARAFQANDRKILETGAPVEFEEVAPHADGPHTYISIKFPIFDVAGQAFAVAGISTDINARKQAEEQLRMQNARLQEMAASERQAHEELKAAESQLVQAEKLSSLGQLVAGVAHEINNPLAYVSNNLVVLQRDMRLLGELLAHYGALESVLEQREPELLRPIRDLGRHIDVPRTLAGLEELAQRSREGLRRIQQVVSDLTSFVRLDQSDREEVDLLPGIESTLNIVRGLASKKGVEIRPSLAPLPPVRCFPARINQVVLNLLINAVDASSQGGRVLLETRNLGDRVEIHVKDTGYGISPAHLDRIFEPFFTTKPSGVGVGLGLSISQSIVVDHGGRLELRASSGTGSHFVVELPVESRAIRAPAAGSPDFA